MEEKIKTEVKREERLLKVLTIVTEWLKFAEAKNAMLIGFNGASIYGITKVLDIEAIKNNQIWSGYFSFVIVLLVFSTIICLIAFVPQIKLTSSGSILAEEPNSIFYEHLKCKSELEIMQLICETREKDFTKFEKDIANQIQQNANIASKKYSYFMIAAWITMSAYITPFTAGIFALITYLQRKKP